MREKQNLLRSTPGGQNKISLLSIYCPEMKLDPWKYSRVYFWSWEFGISSKGLYKIYDSMREYDYP